MQDAEDTEQDSGRKRWGESGRGALQEGRGGTPQPHDASIRGSFVAPGPHDASTRLSFGMPQPHDTIARSSFGGAVPPLADVNDGLGFEYPEPVAVAPTCVAHR